MQTQLLRCTQTTIIMVSTDVLECPAAIVEEITKASSLYNIKYFHERIITANSQKYRSQLEELLHQQKLSYLLTN